MMYSDEYFDDLLVRMAHHSTAIEGNTLTQGETKSIRQRMQSHHHPQHIPNFESGG